MIDSWFMVGGSADIKGFEKGVKFWKEAGADFVEVNLRPQDISELTFERLQTTPLPLTFHLEADTSSNHTYLQERVLHLIEQLEMKRFERFVVLHPPADVRTGSNFFMHLNSLPVLLENLPGHSSAELRSMSWELPLCLDVGHARLANNLPELTQLPIRKLHLHGNDGVNDLHLLPNRTNTPVATEELLQLNVPVVLDVQFTSPKLAAVVAELKDRRLPKS